MRRHSTNLGVTAIWLAAGALAVLAAAAVRSGAASPAPAAAATPDPIHKIQHIVIIMQENRSFDSYFGTYPGADGIPMKNGVPAVCVNDPATGRCVAPYHDAADVNHGGPHGAKPAIADVDGGKMDGFIGEAENNGNPCVDPHDPNCTTTRSPDVMGYHDQREIPNYWTYAGDFVLQDRMFEPNASWSLPEHLFMVSEWSARCSTPGDAMSCVNDLETPVLPPDYNARQRTNRPTPDYAWTDLTYLLHQHGVSWAYYIFSGSEPDCEVDEANCVQKLVRPNTPGIWNPLPYFDTVRQDGELGNIQDLRHFYAAAAA